MRRVDEFTLVDSEEPPVIEKVRPAILRQMSAFNEDVGAAELVNDLGGAAGVDREMGGVPDGSHHERAASQGGGESSRFHERGEENAGRGSIMELMIRINDRRVKINGVF
jgi:hypothetical protein